MTCDMSVIFSGYNKTDRHESGVKRNNINTIFDHLKSELCDNSFL
jgi:hypothetical protein